MSDNDRARKVVIASFLGWALDALDFFLMVFVFSDVAKEFGASITTVTVAVTLTLAMRPVGAVIFGRLADHYGRKPLLMISILCYSILELLSGLAPTLISFLVLRALFGVAMGGEWGIGSSLTMESIPPQWRGWVSGLLQSGYPAGYFLATVAFYVVYPLIGWRGRFLSASCRRCWCCTFAATCQKVPTGRHGRWRPVSPSAKCYADISA